MKKILTVCFFALAVMGHAAFNLTWAVPAVSLDSNPPPGDTDLNVTIASDRLGNAAAAWGRTTGKGASEDIWAASYRHGARVWTSGVQISCGANSANPTVAMDHGGNALFLWEEGFPSQIVYRVQTAKGVWRPALSLPAKPVCPSTQSQTLAKVAIDGDGHALAIWMEYSGDQYQIRSGKKLFGKPWADLGVISSKENSAQIHLTAPLALNRSGEAIAVWQEVNNSTGFAEIHGARYHKGIWQSPLLVFANADQHSLFPSVGIDEGGNAVIVWNQFGKENLIQSRSWVDGELSSQILTASDPLWISQRPFVAVDAQGHAIVVYERYDKGLKGSNSVNKYIAATTLCYGSNSWSTPVDISGPSLDSTLATSAGFPILSVNALGDAVALWKEYDGMHTLIRAAGYSMGTWSLYRTLSSPQDNSGGHSYDLAVSINEAGSIIAVWPEDPSGIQSHQIKAAAGVGLAIASPHPPISLPQQEVAEVTTPSVTLPPVTMPVTHIDPPLPIVTQIELAEAIVDPPMQVWPGTQVFHRFPGHGDLINQLNWAPPASPIAYYRIYRGGLSSLIGTSKIPYYEDHQRIPGKLESYLITCVDENGQESVPATILVAPL